MNRLLIYSLPIVCIGSIVLLTLQFEHFGLMWQTGKLLAWVLGAWAIKMALIGWWIHRKHGDLKTHITEWALVGVALLPVIFLLMSKINQLGTSTKEVPFTFAMEQGILTSPMGVIKGEKRSANKYKLTVLDADGKSCTFSYKNGPLYPLTQPGEAVALPMRCGLLGADWVQIDGSVIKK